MTFQQPESKSAVIKTALSMMKFPEKREVTQHTETCLKIGDLKMWGYFCSFSPDERSEIFIEGQKTLNSNCMSSFQN